MLQCKIKNAAMQTSPLSVASGIHTISPDHEAAVGPLSGKGT
jgi:hypothetical protein